MIFGLAAQTPLTIDAMYATKTVALLAAFVASASAFSIAPGGLAPSAFRGNAVNTAPAAPRARACGPIM